MLGLCACSAVAVYALSKPFGIEMHGLSLPIVAAAPSRRCRDGPSSAALDLRCPRRSVVALHCSLQ